MLEPQIAMVILQYDPSQFRKLLQLSPNWHFLCLEGMDDLCKKTEIGFINQYFQELLYKRSYTNSSVVYAGGTAGLRIDRVLVCEVLKAKETVNKCLRVSYCYQLTDSPKELCADFKLDILPQAQPRLVWIHKDETEQTTLPHQIADRPCIQPIC
jgi:hypothetical protein